MTGKRGQKLRGSALPPQRWFGLNAQRLDRCASALVGATYSGKGLYCLVLQELEMVDERDDGMVIPAQGAVYVFRNQAGTISIREEMPDGDAMWVSFRDEHARAIVEAIRKLVAEGQQK